MESFSNNFDENLNIDISDIEEQDEEIHELNQKDEPYVEQEKSSSTEHIVENQSIYQKENESEEDNDEKQLEKVRELLEKHQKEKVIQEIDQRLEDLNITVETSPIQNSGSLKKQTLNFGNNLLVTELPVENYPKDREQDPDGGSSELFEEKIDQEEISEDTVGKVDFIPSINGEIVEEKSLSRSKNIDVSFYLTSGFLKLVHDYLEEKQTQELIEKKETELERLKEEYEERVSNLETEDDNQKSEIFQKSEQISILKNSIEDLQNNLQYNIPRHLFGDTNEEMAHFLENNLKDAVDTQKVQNQNEEFYSVHLDLAKIDNSETLQSILNKFDQAHQMKQRINEK